MVSSRYSLCLAFFLIIVTLIPGTTALECNIGSDAALDLGGSAIICVHIIQQATTNTTNDTVSTYAFKATVDTFSALKISNIANQLAGCASCRVKIQFQNTAQDKALDMFLASSSQSQSVFSFVVNIKKGLFQKLTIDNQACSPQANNCHEGYYVEANKMDSDPKFFISWIGTDKSGNYMLSHTKRLSRFSMYSVQNIFERAKTLVTG